MSEVPNHQPEKEKLLDSNQDQLAGRMETIRQLSPEKQALLAMRLKEKRAQASRSAGTSSQMIPRRENLDEYPMSHAQRRMWFLSQWEPESPIYNIISAIGLKGELNIPALQQSYNEILRRHEILRARYVTQNGQPVQVVDPFSETEVPVVDLSALEPTIRSGRYAEIVEKETKTPFKLAEGRLLRACLVKFQPDDFVLFLTFHHIISDGWSIGVFIRESAVFYDHFSKVGAQSNVLPLPDLQIQYADYASWQNNHLTGELLDTQLRYWKETLGGADEYLELPTDYSRPTIQTFNGAYYKFKLPKSMSDGVRALAKQQDVTLFMIFLSAFQVLLHRYTGQDDIRVGVPIANRNRAEVEGLIGLFVNTLVMRGVFRDGIRFREYLARMRDIALGAYANQDLPLEMLLDELNVQRDLSRTPLYQVMFTLQEPPLQALSLPSLDLTILEPESGTAKFELTLFVEDQPDGFIGSIEYNSDLFNEATIDRMAHSFQMLLSGILADPQARVTDLPILAEAQHKQILITWNDTFAEYPSQVGLAELFQAKVRKFPDKVAVRFPEISTNSQQSSTSVEEVLTYGQLNERVNQIANYLRTLGVGPNDLVGIYMERSLMMIIATLGIIKAGGAYLPLDLSYPPERLAFMLQDSKTQVLVTNLEHLTGLDVVLSEAKNLGQMSALQTICVDRDLEQRTIEAQSNLNPPVYSKGEDLAYVIYTSGSTGKPKGVAIQQRAVSRLVFNTNYIDILSTDRIAHASNPSFDAATFEIWGAFLHGAEMVGVSRETALSAKAYASYLKDKEITTLFLTTALFNHLAFQVPGAFASLKYLLFGGETADVNAVRSVLQTGKPEHLIHVYGPTECTTFATWHEVLEVPASATSVPIGKPLTNTQAYVLDKHMLPVPVGVAGELFLGGDGLASGYLDKPELTLEKFVPSPFLSDMEHPPLDRRLYKTGDRVRLLPDGNIDFLGRFDFQVKLRGLRIELGEIESALGSYPAILESLVLLREDIPGDKRLVAYLVQRPGRSINLAELRKYLKDKLPDFMVPAAFVILEKLPINPNGKVDRRALPAPDQTRPDLEKAYIPPRTAVEKYLTSRWQEVLGIDRIGIYDDFFELGGDSLKAAVLMNRLQEELGGATHVRALFMAPTVADLTLYMNEYYPQAVEKIQTQFLASSEAISMSSGRLPEEINSERINQASSDLVTTEKIELLRKIIRPLPRRDDLPLEKNYPAVFVLSPPRSGSTLLRTMLAGNPALFSPPELDLLSFNTLAERRAAFSGPYSFWLEGVERAIMELKGCDADQARQTMQEFEQLGLSTKEFYKVFQQWIADSSFSKHQPKIPNRLLVDKTPVYALDLEILKRAEQDFDRPYYIHLMRHPFASIYSFIEAKLDGVFFRYNHPFTQRELAELVWIVSHQNILDFLSGIPHERQIRLSFETMVNQPDKEMEKICAFLGINFNPEMLKPYDGNRMTSGVRPGAQMVGDFKFYLRKDIDPKAADRWKRFQGNDDLSDQGWIIAEKLGYEPPEKGTPTKAHLTDRPPIIRIPREGELPLSFAQRRLWFLDQWDPGSSNYNVPAAVRLQGRLNIQAMRRTLNEIIRRHEVLRTRFLIEDGKPVLIIDDEHVEAAMEVIKAEGMSIDDVHQLAIDESRKPFDLSQGPLIRACLYLLGKDDCLVVLTMHHIVSDGWSAGVIIREIAALYSAFSQDQPSPLSELPIQYVDYAAWQRNWLQGAALERQLDYWKKQLAGIPTLLQLPTDRPRPAVQSLRGARRQFEFPISLFNDLKRLSQKEGVTLYMTLLAAFQALLSRYTGQEDICVGTPIANRTSPEIESLIGFFVNTLVMRGDLSSDPTFKELIEQVKQAAVEAYDHQDLPFERLVDDLQPERNQSHTPLFQVMFTLQESPIQSLKLTGITLSPVQIDTGSAKFDLIMTMIDRGDVLKGVLEYSTDLFDPATIDRMITHYQVLLESVVKSPDQRIASLPLLTTGEYQRLIVEWNQTYDPTTDLLRSQTISALFEEQVEKTPDRIAVEYEDKRLTFRDLNERSNQLARYLRTNGVAADMIVGLCVERSLEMIIGILGIIKAGGAYLPLDPEYPPDRLDFIIKDSGVSILLTQENLRFDIAAPIRMIALDSNWSEIGLFENGNLVPVSASANLAYVIYTSGSTGRPKGTLIEHHSAINLWLGLNRVIYANHPGLYRISLNAPLPFDASVQQWAMLLSGHTVVIIPADVRQDGAELLKYIRKHQIEILDCVPSQLKLLIEAGMLSNGDDRASDAFYPEAVLPGGEAIDPKTWETLSRTENIRFYNMYGPTECTVDSTICQVDLYPTRPSIGRPIVNASAFILDHKLQPVPIGVPGELFLGGDGVGRGYLNRADLAAEKFIPNPFVTDLRWPPFTNQRLYRTGDLARYLPDGYLEYLGRVDFQVKYHGFRIELGEIENVLMQDPGVKEAIVMVREDEPGDTQMVAYVVPDITSDTSLNISQLRNHLKAKLPDYMVPGVYVILDALPLTPNRKVDRKALPKPEGLRPELSAAFEAPVSELEQLLADIWAKTLKLDRVGVDDNFFDLGGDSILSIQVVSRANQAGLRLTPRQIFEAQTVRELARIAGDSDRQRGRFVIAEQGVLTGKVELNPVQISFLKQSLPNPHHWNQSLLFLVRQPLNFEALTEAISALIQQHDVLRLRFSVDAQSAQAIMLENEDKPVTSLVDLSTNDSVDQIEQVETISAQMQHSLNIFHGPLIRVVYFFLGAEQPGRLLFIIHHLAIDGVSWRILLQDLLTAYDLASKGKPILLPPKTSSFKSWSEKLVAYAQSPEIVSELGYWLAAQEITAKQTLDVDFPTLDFSENIESTTLSYRFSLGQDETHALLREALIAFHTDVVDILLTALLLTLDNKLSIVLEGHGREEHFADIDLTRTVGWFTTMYPVYLEIDRHASMGEAVMSVKEQLRKIPRKGIGYGLLRYLNPIGAVLGDASKISWPYGAPLSFNYLGQVDQALPDDAPLALASESTGQAHDPAGRRGFLIDIIASITHGQLRVEWLYSEKYHRKETIEALALQYQQQLLSLIKYLTSEDGVGSSIRLGYTPSDFPDADLRQDEIENLLEELMEGED